jgi:hypothetical protein
VANFSKTCGTAIYGHSILWKFSNASHSRNLFEAQLYQDIENLAIVGVRFGTVEGEAGGSRKIA